LHGDIRLACDFEDLPAADWVIDAAANPSVLAGLAGNVSSRQLFEHNVGGIVNVLEYCKQHHAGLLLLSSSRVYSIPALRALPLKQSRDAFHLNFTADLPVGISERGIGVDFSTEAPVSLYGATKLACEAMALEYGEAFGFPVWINRCGVLAGPGQFGTPEQGIFTYWVNSHLRRRPLRYIGFDGTGTQVRDALHPRDLAELLDLQMHHESRGDRRIYTAGGGPENALSLSQLTAWCDARFGAFEVTADSKERPYDIPWVVMDNCDCERDFGWQPNTSMAMLLEEIAVHAEANPGWLEHSGL
jgi:CDP-paratose 2-epimerase